MIYFIKKVLKGKLPKIYEIITTLKANVYSKRIENKIFKYYAGHPILAKQFLNELEFLKDNGLSVFPYPWALNSTVEVDINYNERVRMPL